MDNFETVNGFYQIEVSPKVLTQTDPIRARVIGTPQDGGRHEIKCGMDVAVLFSSMIHLNECVYLVREHNILGCWERPYTIGDRGQQVY